MIEFTVGPYLFIGRVTGQPGIVPQAAFGAGVKALYEHARRRAR